MLWFHLVAAHLPLAIVVTRSPAANDCPDTGNLAARVERITEGAVTSPDVVKATVAVDFSRGKSGYQARIRLMGEREGERIVHDESPTCDALADAVAVTTALLLDPTARATLGARESHRQVPTSRFWFSGRLGASAGLVGGASWMAGAGLEASLGAVTFLHFGAVINGARENELGAGAVDVDLWYLSLDAFRSLTGETFQFGPTVAFMGGALRGEGVAYSVTSAASLPWFAVGAGLRVDFGVGPLLRLGVRSLAIVPTRQQSFSVGYVGTAYESRKIAGIAEVVVDVRVW